MECLYGHMGKALLGHHCGAFEEIFFYKYIHLILNYVAATGVGGNVCMSVGTEARRQQPLEIIICLIWVLGTKLSASGKAASVSNCRVMSPVPKRILLPHLYPERL